MENQCLNAGGIFEARWICMGMKDDRQLVQTRMFLFAEALAFTVAALIHTGLPAEE